jgi:hypothetical protein
MSPAKTPKQKKPVGLGRDRTEIIVAVLVAVGIALVTIIFIWALRPGSPGSRGEGGIMTRQPRVFLWLFIFGAILAWVIYWVLNRRFERVSRNTAVAIAAVIVVAAAVIAAFFWPGGFLRNYPSFKIPDTPPVTEPTTPGSTTVGSTTPATTSASTTPPTSPPTTASTPTT